MVVASLMMADMLLHGYVHMQAGMVVNMMGCNMCMYMDAAWQVRVVSS